MVEKSNSVWNSSNFWRKSK